MSQIKLKDFCTENSISYITGYRWFKAGQIPGAYQTNSGTILIPDDREPKTEQSTDAMSLFLKKTVEFSKNNSTVEDFAAYVISNFQLKINNTSDEPKYSKHKPKSEEVQKHFQQFIPKREKPKPNSFVMEPETFGVIPDIKLNPQELVNELLNEYSKAVGHPVPPPGYVSTNNPAVINAIANNLAGSMSPEGTVTQSVDVSSTPQPINIHTGSNNLAFSSSLSSIPIDNVHVGALLNNSVLHTDATNGLYISSISGQDNPHVYFSDNSDGLFFTNSSAAPTETKIAVTLEPTQPRKRGRKPSKK